MKFVVIVWFFVGVGSGLVRGHLELFPQHVHNQFDNKSGDLMIDNTHKSTLKELISGVSDSNVTLSMPKIIYAPVTQTTTKVQSSMMKGIGSAFSKVKGWFGYKSSAPSGNKSDNVNIIKISS